MNDHLSFDFAQSVLSEYDEDKHLGVTMDHYGESEAGGHAAELLMPLGTLARPLDPDTQNDGSPQGACTVLSISEGDNLQALPLNDPRVMSSLPPLKKGGFLTYCPAATGSFAVFDGQDPKKVNRPGTFTLSTKYGTPAKAHLFTMDVRTKDAEAVQLKHGDGMGLQMVSGGLRSAVLRNAAGDAYLELNDEGSVLVGKMKLQGSLTVGQMGAAESLVKVSALLAWATAVEAALAAALHPVPTPLASLLTQLKTNNLKAT